MSRSVIRPWPTAFSTGWGTTLTASRCAASRCAKSAAAKKEYCPCGPKTPSGRRGNAAPWKAWETPRTSFPPFPPGLEIRHKTAGFPHFHRAGGGLLKRRKDEKKTEFQLTDSITSSTIRTPASLRSENDQLHLGTSDWDPIGITNHLHRNKQHMSRALFVPDARRIMYCQQWQMVISHDPLKIC